VARLQTSALFCLIAGNAIFGSGAHRTVKCRRRRLTHRFKHRTAPAVPCCSTSSFLVAMASLLRVSSRRTFPGRNTNGLSQAIVFYLGAAARSECPHRHSPRTETQGSELFIVAVFAQRATACCARCSFWAWPAPTAAAPCSAWSSWLPIGTPCPQHGFQP
jgi:hypothetical protein